MSSTISRWKACIFLALATSILNLPAGAAELKIGYKSDVTAADPHVLVLANRNIWAHIYETLVARDELLRAKPGLALSWIAVNPTTWEFKLRPNVKFHNGDAFSADDVKYSIERAMHATGVRTYRTYLGGIASVNVTGPLTVQVKTSEPHPTLPDNLSMIPILPKSLGSAANEENFAKGTSAIGTGPYKFGKWSRGERLALVRNANYWGDKEPWDSVTIDFLTREPARAAALLAGAVDAINGVTSNVTDSLTRSNKIATESVTSYLLIYLQFDQLRDNSPFIKSNSGQPLEKNPLRNLKVRQALMHAVNRDGIIKYLMKGDAVAAGQIVPKGFFGHDASLQPPAFDLAKAKSLLAEAGYPEGFRMTLHCTNDFNINDGKMCEAVAQSFSQIGVKTEVAAMPYAVFIGRATKGEFSVYMLGNGAATGDSLQPLTALVHTVNKAAGLGASNYNQYSNKEVDALIEKASKAMDPKAREELQKAAAKAALEDGGIIPLVHQTASWAFKKELALKPRSSGFTFAMDIRPRGEK